MRAQTKKLTTAAVCTALAVIMCVFTAYLPFSFMPLYIAALCIFLACMRGSPVYGLLCAMATIGIMFAMTGLSVSWFLLVIMFAPYGIMTYFLHGFTYFKVKSGILRGIIAVAFFNLTMWLVYLTATNILTIGLDIPVTEWVDKLGGYWALALIGTAVLVPLDFIFSVMSRIILRRLPGGTRQGPVGSAETEKHELPDIFGYDEPETGESASDGGQTADGVEKNSEKRL